MSAASGQTAGKIRGGEASPAIVALSGAAAGSAGKAHPAPIDRAHLARFTFGNQDLEIEVLGLFAAQAPLTLAELARADTAKAWRNAAHTLKGSARAVGAFQVADWAERAERAGIEAEAGLPSEADRRAALEALEAAVAEARGHIETLALAD